MLKPYSLIKRIFDILFSLLFLIILSPVFLLIFILIKLDSEGPAIFVQKRIGKNKREFSMYKFRTMCLGSELKLESLMSQNEAHFPAFKMKNDPRLTGFGKKLRKTGLDELPQLLNILKGDMSFVGFRPPLPEEVIHYKKWHMKRFDGIPGIVSLWVISGGHSISFDRWIRLDISYEKNKSLFSDLYIFSECILMVFRLILKKFRFSKFRFRSTKSWKKNLQKTILFYVKPEKGLGHVSRIAKLSKSVVDNFPDASVIVLCDTRHIDMFDKKCDIIKLPWVNDDFSKVLPEQLKHHISLISVRQKIIFDVVSGIKPDLFLVDHVPRGSYDELAASIEFLNKKGKVFFISRDIIDSKENTILENGSVKILKFLNKYYHKYLIFGDKDVFNFRNEYDFELIKDKITYLGYLSGRPLRRKSSNGHILISLGSGTSGFAILQKLLVNISSNKKIRVLTGPNMDPEKISALRKEFRRIDFIDYVNDVAQEYEHSSLVITMGGYNSLCELMNSDIPVLIVPYESKGWKEQLIRARLFKENNIFNYIHLDDITKERLCKEMEIAVTISKKRRKSLQEINTDGYENFVRFIDYSLKE